MQKNNQNSFKKDQAITKIESSTDWNVEQPITAETSTQKTKHRFSKKAPKKKRKHAELISFAVKMGMIGAIVAFLLLFIVNIRIVHSNDMYPSIRDGELVLVSKVSSLLDDTIVLYQTDDGAEHLGRIMGMPGNEMDITEDAGVWVSGNIIYQTVPYKTPKGRLKYPYIVPEDSYFILNDYRELETDSRTYGAIHKDRIIGTVIFALQYRGF